MMPFEDIRNPWLHLYPLLASCGVSSGHQALYYAILTQASENLASLRSEDKTISQLKVECYTEALRHLRATMSQEVYDFSIVLATILMLIIAEVYLYM